MQTQILRVSNYIQKGGKATARFEESYARVTKLPGNCTWKGLNGMVLSLKDLKCRKSGGA